MKPFSSSKGQDCSSSDDDDDNNDSNAEENSEAKSSTLRSKDESCKVGSWKRKRKGIDFEALKKHGYKGGLSVLKVPDPKVEDEKQDWSWSNGKDARPKEKEETYHDRVKTRDALIEAEQLIHARTQKEETYHDRVKTRDALIEAEQLIHARTQKEKNLSFSQKEKRKRDMGQASRGKSYVEEEKRLLRESGIYSGFDS